VEPGHHRVGAEVMSAREEPETHGRARELISVCTRCSDLADELQDILDGSDDPNVSQLKRAENEPRITTLIGAIEGTFAAYLGVKWPLSRRA
jgi:hypothetical protein